MDISYLATPFLAWLITGTMKFIVNSVRARRLAFDLIGYGGMPSNHSAIVTSMAVLIVLKEGVSHPAFGVAITVAFIVMLDANSLRRQLGRHAETVNRLAKVSSDLQLKPLRERVGHTMPEILAGIASGTFAAVLVYYLI